MHGQSDQACHQERFYQIPHGLKEYLALCDQSVVPKVRFSLKNLQKRGLRGTRGKAYSQCPQGVHDHVLRQQQSGGLAATS